MSEGIHRLLPHSLRWRLQVWQACLLAAVLAGFGFAVYQRERITRLNQIDNDLTARISILNSAVRNAPFTRGPGNRFDGRRPPPMGRRGPPPGPPPGDFHPHRPPPGQRPTEPRGSEPRGSEPDGSEPSRVEPGRFEHGPPPDGPPPQAVKPGDLTLPPDAEEAFSKTSGFYFIVWYRDGSVLKRSSDAPAPLPEPRPFERDTLTHWRTRGEFHEAFHCTGFGDCFLAGRSIAADLSALRTFSFELLGAGGIVLALGISLGWWFISRAIRPIGQIAASAGRISQGNLSERIPVSDSGNELLQLAGILNSTFARLESAFARQRQFTADAAHELRTPLAVVIAETQGALNRERTAAEYKEVVEGCLASAQEMRRLTESLLTLARFDDGDDPVPRANLDIAEIARQVLEKNGPLADRRGIAIRTDLRPAHAFTNPDRLTRVITNLVTNAIDYNRIGGSIQIETKETDEAAILTIADAGIGIAQDHLPHIFDRFYRADKSRSSADGHTGLGLAICKAIVEAERGGIEVASTPGQGTTFTVRLPTT